MHALRVIRAEHRSLAAVILRMASLDLPVVDEFPFLEPPGPRAIADGYQLLQELGVPAKK